jgi:hypothetical protein
MQEAVNVLIYHVESQVLSVVDSDFFSKSLENAKQHNCSVSLNCFKIVIKALCRTGKFADFELVKLIL